MRIALLILISFAFTPLTLAQTLTVRLLNGKSGKPIANKMVTFDWGDTGRSQILVDKDGVGHAYVPHGVTSFIMREGPNLGYEPFRVAYQDCNQPMTRPIQVADVVERGITPPNACGAKTIDPRPRVVVFWGLPRPWWQPDMQ